MKFFAAALLLCATLSVAVALIPVAAPAAQLPAAPGPVIVHPAAPATVAPPPPPPPPTLKQDLQQLKFLLPTKEIKQLIRRYLLNDAEFQGVIRTINSYDAYMATWRLKSQPEVIAFNVWVRMQMKLSGGGSSSSEEDSSELKLFNKSPFWANSVYGWQGFISEFMIFYPEFAIRDHIQMKVLQGGSFAEYWRRVQSLRIVFDRFLLFPETQRVIAQLQENGVDTVQLETFVRAQFGWVVPAVPAASAAVVA